MTEAQKLQIREVELRDKRMTLEQVTERTDAQNTELETTEREHREVLPKLAKALKDVPDATPIIAATDSEGREYRELLGKADLADMVGSIGQRRAVTGAGAELQQHHKLAPTMIALDQLRGEPVRELRGVTAAAANTESNQAPIEQPVFASGDAAFLGVSMPTVAQGDAVYPVLSARPVVRGPHADSTDAVESDGSWTADLLAPQRIQASYIVRKTDLSRFPGMSEGLRQALSAGLSEKLDAQFIAQVVTDTGQIARADADTFASYIENLLYKRIDGRYAMTESDIRLLLGTDTYSDLASTYRAAESAETALTHIKAAGVMCRVSPHIPDVAATKQDCVVRRGLRQDAVIPIWQGVDILEDVYTGRGKGEIEISAVMQCNWKVTRVAGFIRHQVDIS